MRLSPGAKRPPLLEPELWADCASDPPLSATRRWLAVHRAEAILRGLGQRALAASPRTRLRAAARHGDAAQALRAAALALGARVEVVQVPDVWPPKLGPGEVIPAERLVEEALGAAQPARVHLTVAGEVVHPGVYAAAPDATVASLVETAGGPRVLDWVPVAGGAPGGAIVGRNAPAAAMGGLVLVLSAGHAVVRRLRTPLRDWLVRAASACEGCRACTEGCPVALGGAALEPHAVIAELVAGVATGTRLAGAAACNGCGLCDALCPGALSPRALVGEVASRIRGEDAGGGGAAAPTGGGLDVGLLSLRLGLGAYVATS